MKSEVKTLYGLIMVSGYQQSIEIYGSINEEWNQTEFEKRLYSSFGEILSTGNCVDPISVIKIFRENNWADNKLIVEISGLTSNITGSSFLYLNSLLSEIQYLFEMRKARLLSSRLKELIESDNFTHERFNNLLEEGVIRANVKQEVTNVDTIFDVVNDHSNAKNGVMAGITLPWSTINREIILESVDVMIVGARPAMGKTAFAVSLAVNLVFQRSLKIAFFSLEMSKKQIVRRIVSNLASIDSNRLKNGECTESEISRVYQIQQNQMINDIHIFEGSHNIRNISQRISELKASEGVDLVIIDYIQKILPTSKGSRYEQVTEVSNGVKMIAQNMKIPVIALAQLSRSGATIGKLPTLTDLKESGEIEQDASVVTFLHRPEYYGEEMTSNMNYSENICEFLVAKNREGSIGKYELGVNLAMSKFYDL